MTLLSIDTLQLVESSVKNKSSSDDGVRTWSTAVQILLPVAALAILWGRRGFFARFFLQFDKNCVSVFCPSFSKRQRLLKWASGRLPPTWSSHANTFPEGPAEFWRDGSLLCTLINSAIPGACPNPHRHWKRPPSHGQALAYKYLGVAPVFTETELLKNGLSLRHEGTLVNYLLQVQQAIANISNNELKFSSRYVARGMGLVVGEQHRKTAFYIYSSSTTSSSKHDVLVSIRGPYNTHCTATIPAYYISRKHLRNHCEDKQNLNTGSKAQRSFLRTLSVDLGSFINVNQKPEVDNDMPIKLVSENERVKVVFIPKNTGVHEISIITNGFHLVGSPFNVNITENTSGIKDTFNESLRYPYRKSKAKGIRRKIISKIIDFIDEKISYDSLKLKPFYEKNIPKIEITSTKESSQENCMDENIITNFEDLTNEHETVVHNFTTMPDLNFEEDEFNAAYEEITSNNLTKTNEEFELRSSAKDNFLNIESNLSHELSNVRLKLNYFNNGIEEIEEVDTNFAIALSPNKSDDCNNNIISVDSPFRNDLLNKSELQSTFTTSPICFDHIEEEVTTTEPNASSEVPTWNFKKKRLRRQNNIDLPDIFGINDSEINKNDQTIKEYQGSDEKLLQSLESNSQMSEESVVENQEKQFIENSGIKKIYTFVVNEMNENLEELNMQKYKNDIQTDNQTTESDINSELEIDLFSGPISLNILNYLSSLKIEDSNTESILKPKNSNFSHIKQQKEFEQRINFKQRLQYWESQTSLDIISDQRHKLSTRRSLPNLLSSSTSELFIFNTENDENCNINSNSETLEFNSQFKERQNYWKELSSQNINCSSISSSTYYLETLGKLNKHRIKARRSLPDLFSRASRNEILSEMSYRNICFPIDFFDSPEAVKFKTRFKECRDFWERLSSQNLKASYEVLYDDSYQQENVDENNFDSGFYNSLPNLSAKSQSGDNFDVYSDSLKFKRQYEERREYWEKLSLHSMSDLSLSSLLGTESNKAEANKNVLLGIKPILLKTSNEYQQKLKTISETQRENRNILKRQEENILRNDSYYSLGDKKWTNLTDDLKQINDKREKMKMNFNQAKTFFKNLEENLK